MKKKQNRVHHEFDLGQTTNYPLFKTVAKL